MSRIYLPWNASKARQRDAERARKNRVEIVRELSWGRVSRRDLMKWGLFTSAGMLAPIGGLNPFVEQRVGRRSSIPTGAPRSPLFGARPFTQAMPRFDVLPRNPLSCLTPTPQAEANQTLMPVRPDARRRHGPVRGTSARAGLGAPALQRVPPGVCVEATQAPATTNYRYSPEVHVEPELRHRSVARDAVAVPSQAAEPEPDVGVDVQRHDPAQAGAGTLRRTAAVPAPQRAARRRAAERRLRPPHDLDARAQRPSRRGERRLHRRASSSRTSSTTTTGRSSSPGTSA